MVDLAKVEERLRRLKEFTADLLRLKGLPKEEFLSDSLRVATAKYLLLGPTFAGAFWRRSKELFVEVLLLAQEFGVLKLGTLSLDGSKVHADASKSKAVSYKRLLELEVAIKGEVEELFHLAEVAEQAELPEGFRVEDEIMFRQVRLERLAQAKAALEARGSGPLPGGVGCLTVYVNARWNH